MAPRHETGRLAAGIVAIAVWLAGTPAGAVTLDLPAAATLAGEDVRAGDRLLVPVGPRTGSGGPGLVAEGRVTRRAWRLPGAGLTPFQLVAPLRDQLVALGFEPRYECRDRECGGFDFRLALDLLPAPAMHVDLGDFRYFAAERDGPEGAEVVSVVTSRSGGAGHVHVTLVTSPGAAEGAGLALADPAPARTPAPAAGDLAGLLETEGHAALEGLAFRPGSSALGEGPFAALSDLAGWLLDDPARAVVLVGHSDNVGGLEDNMRLSERRAEAVAEALVRDHGVPADRLSARGVGYLAPIAPNATPEGRRLNRRVEAVVVSP